MSDYQLTLMIINICYLFLLLTFIVITVIKPKKQTISEEAVKTELKFEDVLKDFNIIVDYKVKNYTDKVLVPIIRKTRNDTILINDEVTNNVVVEITDEILKLLSDGYKANLIELIGEENLESFTLDLVYTKVSNIVMSLNKNTIQKLK